MNQASGFIGLILIIILFLTGIGSIIGSFVYIGKFISGLKKKSKENYKNLLIAITLPILAFLAFKLMGLFFGA